MEVCPGRRAVPTKCQRNFQNMSVPTTPADSWGRGEGEFMHQNRDLSSSVSSVEEATEAAVVTPRSKSKSRLSLNLGVFDSVSLAGPGSPARSPRFLPKFLRSSFSKLLQGKDRTPEPPIEPLSLPFFSSVLSRSRCPTPEEDEIEIEESPPSSPTTKNFVEESLAKGLPIIPFNYPTFVIVEKKISDARASHHRATSPLPGPPLFSSWGATEKMEEVRSVSAPSSRKTSKREGRLMGMGQSVDDKSLSSVVSMAKQEMEEEKQEGSVRKPSWIRGYAFNNSRALHRRRSSVTEYVAPMDETTVASSNTQQQADVVRTHRPKLRGTKSLCQAENMRFIHEESPSDSEQLSQLEEEYKRELSQNFCLPETRMEMEGREMSNFHLESSQSKAKDQTTSPYLDMECGRAGRRAVSGQQDVKPTMVA